MITERVPDNITTAILYRPSFGYAGLMGAPGEYELIRRAVEFALSYADHAEADVVNQLETEASTPLVSALRMLTMHSSILAVGSLSVFEALLQQTKGWNEPLKEVGRILRAAGKVEIADQFDDLRAAINVLKHGRGPSYERLLAKHASLPFRIKLPTEAFFDEGDVSEGVRLIDADHRFVRHCAQMIEQVAETLRTIGANSTSLRA